MPKNKFYLIFVPFILTGCNVNGAHTGGNSNNENDDYIIKEDVTIDFLSMANSDYLKRLQSYIDEFEKTEPHVKVNLYNPLGSGNYTLLEKIIVSGFFKEDYPDIAQCYPDNVVKYIAQGYAVKLDNYLDNDKYGINAGEDKDDYISSFMDEGSKYPVEGTYSLPFCKSTELMYYNADALIGLDLSNVNASINNGNPLDEEYLNDLTWEELFEELCPAIKTYNDSLDDEEKIMVDNDNSAVFTYDSDDNFFITLAEQHGYGYTSMDEEGKGSIDFDNPEMKELVKKLKIAKDNKYLQTKGTYRDYVSDLFQNRECLFTVSSTAGLSYNYSEKNPFKIGVAKIPHAEGKNYVAINQGPSVCILDHKNENRSLASYLLWKHITSKKNSSDWALYTGYMGIRHSSYETDEYKATIENVDASDLKALAAAENLKKIAEVRELTFNTPVFRGSGNARSNVSALLKECLLSEDLDNEIDDLFKSYSDDTEKYLK